jgi:predicted DNA-binding transcriptional regulator AlpA
MKIAPITPEVKRRPSRPLAQVPETLHREQRIPLGMVIALTGYGKTKVFGMVAAGELPGPEHDGPRWARWRAGDILDWLECRRQARRDAAAAPAAAPAAQPKRVGPPKSRTAGMPSSGAAT